MQKSTSSIAFRYYDKEGLLPDLQRKESGYRVFSDRDLEAIDLIECFKESGLTIREIRHFMSLVRQGDVTLDERLAIYQTHIARLEEKLAAVQNALEHSRRTLAFYEIAAKQNRRRRRKISTSPGIRKRRSERPLNISGRTADAADLEQLFADLAANISKTGPPTS